jgi:hypothetical protein
MNEGTRVVLELAKSGMRAGREQEESRTIQDEGATSTLRRIVQLPLFRGGIGIYIEVTTETVVCGRI